MRPRRRPDGDSLMVLCPPPPLAAAAKDNVVNDWIANARAAVFERLEKCAGAAIESQVGSAQIKLSRRVSATAQS